MKVYIISGKSGSGKSTLARILKKNLGKCVVTSFSKYIKLYAKELINYQEDDEKPREFLQKMGDYLRSKDEDFLSKRMIDDINIYEHFVDFVVIDDARCIREVEKIGEYYDTFTIRINRNRENDLTDEEKEHHTELELDNYEFDYIIENNDLNELEVETLKIIERSR